VCRWPGADEFYRRTRSRQSYASAAGGATRGMHVMLKSGNFFAEGVFSKAYTVLA
jgi:hypothetical protein